VQYPNEIFFLIATVILWGLVAASKPLVNQDKFFQPESYWFLAFVFTASAFTFFAIASTVNLALITMANTLMVAGYLYIALFFRFLRRSEVSQHRLLPLLAILAFGLTFEYVRQRGGFVERVFLVIATSSLCLIWQLIELSLLGKVRLNKLKLFFFATLMELVLALIRLGALFFQKLSPGMNLYQEPLEITLIRWSWFAFTVISYVALIGYWINKLSIENAKTTEEINTVKLELAHKKLEQSELQFLASLNALAKARDNETGNHIIRTQNYVKVLALRLRKDGHYAEELTDQNVELLFKAAPLHDIGKIGIPDHILLKKGPLTDQEWEVMKTHTLIGESVLNASEVDIDSDHDLINKAINIAGGHHEKWDGTGYPRGLAGEAIPLAARIMSLADMYDALVNERVYKKAWAHEKAVEEIISKRRTQFDPFIVDAFIAEQTTFKDIADQYRDV
jgi:hypothetical protein